MLLTKSIIGIAVMVATCLFLGLIPTAGAQEQGVQIAELECNGRPELVLIKNFGTAEQSLIGWQLQSDPSGSEVFDLAVLGGLAPGVTISIQSGPSAAGVFKWSLESVFRDDDPTDYARIVDDTGAVVHQVNCAGGVASEPSPTPSPEPSSIANVPNGGGAPPVPGAVTSPLLMLVVGGSMVVIGAATLALPALQPIVFRQVGHPSGLTVQGEGRPFRPRLRPTGQRHRQVGLFHPGLGLALAGIAVTIAILVVKGGRSGRS
jgi:hypothetical protein